MAEPLQFLWPAIEAVSPVFARAAIIRWPKWVHEQLVAAGLIVPQGTSIRIRCPECGETHFGTPFLRQQPDGTMRAFIHCRKHGRAQVTDRDLQQWAASVESLVWALATSLSLGGKIVKLNSDRVWRCGRWTYQGGQRDVLFARGLRRHDAIQFRRAITAARRPVIFVGSEIPDADYWQGGIPPLIRLREVATLTNGKIEIDVTQVIGLVKAADDLLENDASPGGKHQRKEIRRAVKEEIKSLVSDDALVAAFKKYGSYAKAAAGLTQEGFETNRWAVERAVGRAGGIKKVRRGDDSESIVRSRSSQRRDTPIEKRDSLK
jgi:hypothetical protein